MLKKALIFILVAIMLLSVVACGKDDGSSGNKGNNGKDTQTEERTLSSKEIEESKFLETYNPEATAQTYNGEEQANVRFDGYEFKFLNSGDVYFMYVYLDPDMTGDTLDDATYMRNFEAEQKFGITIKEETQQYDQLSSYAKTLILAEEDIYDVMYIRCDELTPLIAENLFVDLLQVKELNMDKVWWDQPLIKYNIIEDRLFYATSDLHLMAFEAVWALYFNEDMMSDLGLTAPYAEALSGKWTFDKYSEFCKAAANLNGDSSYTFDANGKATYGTVTTPGIVAPICYAFHATEATRNAQGKYEFTAHTDTRYQDAMTKLIGFIGGNDGQTAVVPNTDFGEDGYFTTFMNERALFLTAELKGCTILREWEGNFGLLPLPKYDEAQDGYGAYVIDRCLSFCIPNTNTNLERTGIIIDYLTYKSYESVVPRYYDIHVGLKSLTKQESKDVLAVIRGSRGGTPALFYRWTAGYVGALGRIIVDGNNALISTIETYKSACEAAIKETYNLYPVLNDAKYD